MPIIDRCQEGKSTPKLVEVLCPQCGAHMEIFVQMGGAIGFTGRTVSDEACSACGAVIPAGTPQDQLKPA